MAAIEERLDAPLEVIPLGQLTPNVLRLIFRSERFQRLGRLRGYLLERQERQRQGAGR